MKKLLLIAATIVTTSLLTGQAFADNMLLEESLRAAEENGLSSDVIRILQQTGFGI